ncbi:MAG: type II secretion system GspH family protein [Planctomycetota bacterium]|nr:type II secretion system protein [Planctomycetaceae bacterium]MDQ3330417.1 type II secretion system GspH family protein [Planctomycetota bacterium]
MTAIESLLAIAILSIAGGALLSSLATAVRTSREIALTTVARGLADQLIAEVVASPVPSDPASATPAAPRANFLVVDHFHLWTESPPQDRFGRVLGTEGIAASGSSSVRHVALQADSALLTRFRRTVTVEKVAPGDGTWIITASDTLFRRVVVEVVLEEDDRTRKLADASRIVCHVAPAL